jgi:hypothetical protein
MTENLSATGSNATSVAKFLSAEGESLRQDLMQLLQQPEIAGTDIVARVATHDKVLVRQVMPTVINGFLDVKKTKDQAQAEAIREAIGQLESEHELTFEWNQVYRNFFKGLGTTRRTTEKDEDLARRVFGENYMTNFELNSDSILRDMAPLARSVEKLNANVESVRQSIFAIRDERVKKAGPTQGLSRRVIASDVVPVKEEYKALCWTHSKRPRTSDTGKPKAKRSKLKCKIISPSSNLKSKY